jgi:hypothetical protein
MVAFLLILNATAAMANGFAMVCAHSTLAMACHGIVMAVCFYGSGINFVSISTGRF